MKILNDKSINEDYAELFFEIINPKLIVKRGEREYNDNSVLQKIINVKNDRYYQKYFSFFQFLELNIHRIIKGKPKELIKLNAEIEFELSKISCSSTEKSKKIFYNFLLEEIFNYKGFRNGEGEKSRNIQWFNLLNLKCCPYCNRNWITYVKNENDKHKLYFDIDHFFPKYKYPWFALSFYNLIPSCTICNQRIKGDNELEIDFDEKGFLHPFLDDFDEIVKFTVPIDSLDVFYDPKIEIKLEIKPRPPRTKTDLDYLKAEKTYLFFNLENLYNTHLDYVRELLQKDIVYSPQYIDQLYDDYGPSNANIFSSKEDLMKMLFGNYVIPEDIHKRPLAKLTKDLIEDFSINMKKN